MKKIIRIGIKDKMSVYCKIIYNAGRLSIGGVEAPLPSGNARGSAGQINPVKVNKFAKGWDAALLSKFNATWEKWHLNDVHAGCEHQRNLGWEKDGYDKHPSEPCPVCGYKFGTAWHKINVPLDVLSFLATLPDADKIPAWV